MCDITFEIIGLKELKISDTQHLIEVIYYENTIYVYGLAN